MGVALRERSALADTLDHTGPGVPTLCTGWDSAHLAAHLVLRERRPDLQVRTLLSRSSDPLTDALDDLATRTPWPQLVQAVRHVPRLHPARLGAVDDRMNTIEFAIHHEDLRRTGSGWEPRVLPADLVEAIWANLPIVARLASRGLDVPVELRRVDGGRPDGRTVRVGRGSGERVQVAGEPLELALFMSGRAAVARVELTGPDDAVAKLRASRLGF